MMKKVMKHLQALLAYSWGYMGTLAAMGLLIGVLGMGIYHACTRDAEYQAMRYFSGVFNSADATPPTGLDELPAHSVPTVPHLRFEYGKNGKPLRMIHISAEGQPSAIPGSKVCEQRLEYDAAGRLTRKSNFAASGAPTTDASGVHARAFSYDDAGRLTRTEFRGTDGKLVVPRMPGYAVETIRYDEKGRPTDIDYLDGKGEPITNARGERSIRYTYDDEHGSSSRTNYIAGAAADNSQGIAREETTTTRDGSTQVTSWYNAEGQKTHHPEKGCCTLFTETSHDGTLHRERRCGEDGTPSSAHAGYAEHLVRTTPGGRVEWECFSDKNGLPCFNEALGYAERMCEYGPDGALTHEYFWDAAGNPCTRYEKRHTHTPDGDHTVCLLSDGSTECTTAHGRKNTNEAPL